MLFRSSQNRKLLRNVCGLNLENFAEFVDCLRDGEKGVNELSEILQIEPANVSQQLAILRVRNIVIGRKAGSNVYYSVSDRRLFRLLDVAKDIFNNHLVGVRDMLQQMEAAS